LDAGPIPEASASWWQLLTFGWITHILALGYARPLEAADLYTLQSSRSAQVVADDIVRSFDARRNHAENYNRRLDSGEVKSSVRKRIWWTIKGGRDERERRWREKEGRKNASLALALNDSVKWWFWSGGILKLVGDTAQVTSPLLVKV
jgi:hypothetical protein